MDTSKGIDSRRVKAHMANSSWSTCTVVDMAYRDMGMNMADMKVAAPNKDPDGHGGRLASEVWLGQTTQRVSHMGEVNRRVRNNTDTGTGALHTSMD